MILLIRHGSAGDPDAWRGDDRLRPLDERGRRQAKRLVKLLAGQEVDRILSSPAVRCVQTVEPLARAHALEIEEREELSVERQWDDGAALVRSLAHAGENAAVSCHGGLSDTVCGERQKKGEAILLDGGTVVGRVRPKG